MDLIGVTTFQILYFSSLHLRVTLCVNEYDKLRPASRQCLNLPGMSDALLLQYPAEYLCMADSS